MKDIALKLTPFFSEEALIKVSNKGTYKRAVKDIENCSDISVVTHNDSIIVKMDNTEVVVHSDFSKCKCSCASKTVCRHIIAGAIVVSEIGRKNGEVPENSEVQTETAVYQQEDNPTVNVDYLNEVISTMENILVKGIMNCSQSDEELLVRMSLKGGTAYKNISNMCRSLAEEINLMNLKNAEFSSINASFLICRIYNTALVTVLGKGEKLMQKNGYISEGNGKFMCLGIYPRHSKSGYAGVTAICFEKENNQFFTYNVTRPDFYDSTQNSGSFEQLKKMLNTRSHWQNTVSLSQISGKNFSLLNFKADERFRISSSKTTSCLVSDLITFDDIPESILELPVKEEYDYFIQNNSEKFFLVRNPVFSEVKFVSAMQKLSTTVKGENIENIPVEIAFNDVSRTVVSFIEQHTDCQFNDCFMLVKMFGNRYSPISLISSSQVRNFWF